MYNSAWRKVDKSMKKTNTSLSIKISKEEVAAIESKAKECGETKSGYARRVLMESVKNPFYTGEDVMRIMMQISYDMACLNEDNYKEVIPKINRKGAWICQILSLR